IESRHVMREVESAVSRGTPIVPFRIEDVQPSKSLDYYLKSIHWLDALTPPLERHLETLSRTVRQVLSREAAADADAQLAVNAALDQGAVVAREKARSRRRVLTYLGAVAALLLLVGSFVAWAALGGLSRSPQPKEAALAPQPASTSAV